MKIIIGINTYHADSSACVMINGKLIAAFEEERINRKKHFSGFPIESIKECLKIADKKDIEITDIAFNTKPVSNIVQKILFYLSNFLIKKNNSLKRINKKNDIKKILFKKFNLNKNVKFHYIEHHLAHIASAFYPSKKKETNAISIDGSGDFVTLAVAKCQNNEIKIIKKVYFPNSLGIFYHAMTQFLGFKNYGDEYKIMGLASYGKPIYFNKIKDNLFKKNYNNIFELNLVFFNHHNANFKYIADEELIIDQIFNDNLIKLFSDDLEKSKDKHEFSINFAASVQKVYEHFFKEIIISSIDKKFSTNLVYAGGCALNSSANKFLTNNKSSFYNVSIPFAPGDNGGALGAAFVVASKYGFNLENLQSPYLGTEYSNHEVKVILDSSIYSEKLKYKFLDDDTNLIKTAALLISKQKVIGWFQGRMEFGPRALGNRSIIADPRKIDMKKIINQKIKKRESFRPFAPAVLSDYQGEWFEDLYLNPYMSSVTNVINDKKELIPAVTHIDGTARIQTVDQNTNYRFAKLIEEFYKLTKVPILLNTSFNENEPIVMTPEQALDCILRTDMDAIIINNFIIEKK